MAKKKNTIPAEIKVIPPNSFVIFRTRDTMALIQSIAHAISFMDDLNIKGIILGHETMFEELSVSQLAALGLQQIPRKDLQ